MTLCSRGVALLCLVTLACAAFAQDAPGSQSVGPLASPPRPKPQTTQSVPLPDTLPPAPPPIQSAIYDPAIFLTPIPTAQLAFLSQFAGAPSGELYRDKEFHKLLKAVVPNCVYRYGRDMALGDALDMVFSGSRVPVQIRENRYVLLSGLQGPILQGRGFLWFDLQTGFALGGFFFHPTNGEPTPVVNVFSRMIKEDFLSLGELPPGFAEDLSHWTLNSGIPPLTMRYFLTGENRKIVLEHDEDFCLGWDGSRLPPDSGCEQMMADAADDDLTGAYFMDATRHVTNATAYMLNPAQTDFLYVRDRTCGAGPDPLGCRIRLTRERTIKIIGRPPPRPIHR